MSHLHSTLIEKIGNHNGFELMLASEGKSSAVFFTGHHAQHEA